MNRYYIASLFAFFVVSSFSVHSQESVSERIWSGVETGNEYVNRNLNYALGYNFTPLVDGKITALGGNFNGNHQVKLFNRATGELLAETYVSSQNNWKYKEIAAVSVKADEQYTVAAYFFGPGASLIANPSVRLPITSGNVLIDGRTYTRLGGDANARPTNNSTYNVVYGRADAVFLADETNPEPEPLEEMYHLTLSPNFTVRRDGAVGDDVTWHIEKNGKQVFRGNAKGELSYRYFRNFDGDDFKAWLVKFIDGAYQRVSNVVEYTPGTTDLFELSLEHDFKLVRSGNIGDSLQWVIEKDGEAVLKRNAANELNYTYFRNDAGSKFRVWLEKFIDGEYKIVSNLIEYEVGQSDFVLSVDQQFELFRNGQLGDQVQWVIEKDGQIVLERNAENETRYQYFSNSLGSSFRVWLKKFINGQYEVVSNVVSYEVPEQYEYALSIDDSYQLTRSGALGDNVSWVIVKDGNKVLSRNAANELTYRYFRNRSGSYFSAYLVKFSGGYSRRVSNVVTYNVP